MTEDINNLPRTPTPEQARAEDFTAAPWQWKGITLEPLAIMREGDWLAHCRRIGLPPLDVAMSGGRETFLPHATRLLWFLAHDPMLWLLPGMQGDMAPLAIELVLRPWCDEHILLTGEDAIAACTLAHQIWNRAHGHQPQVDDTASEEEDEDEQEQDGKAPAGEPHGLASPRSTSRSSARPSPASARTTRAARSTGSATTSRRSKAGRSRTARALATATATRGRTTRRPPPKRKPSKPA